MKTKPLSESAKELQMALNRFSKARRDIFNVFMNVKPERYPGDSYFKTKFGDKVDGGYGQQME